MVIRYACTHDKRARRHGSLDSVLSVFGWYPYKCRCSSRRFHKFGRGKQQIKMVHSRVPNTGRALGGFLTPTPSFAPMFGQPAFLRA